MPDKKGEKVERFKLTPEQKAFAQRFRSLKMIQSVLEGETMKEQARFKSLQQMWKELNGEFQMLQQQTPQEPTHELSGMDFGAEFRKGIRY